MTLTAADLDRAAQDDHWLGWGYLGERLRASQTTDPECTIDPAVIARTDEYAITVANEKGWDYPTLLAWCDSKYGRWYADTAYPDATPERLAVARQYVTVDSVDGLGPILVEYYR